MNANMYLYKSYEALGQTIHLTEENSSTLTEMFFIPLYPQEETIGIRKIRSAANIKKFKYFDLLGRPAISKHSVQIRKQPCVILRGNASKDPVNFGENCCERDSSFFLYAMMLVFVVFIDGMSTFLFEQNVFFFFFFF